MFKRFLAHQWFPSTISAGCLLTGWLLATPLSVHAETNFIPPEMDYGVETVSLESSLAQFEGETESQSSTVPNDPLDSPFPVPWQWLIETQQEFSSKGTVGQRYYRSQALLSPDGQYAAYTRISMIATPELHESQATSVMFLENLQTGELQVIRPDSPLAKHLHDGENPENEPGIMSILIPVSWSSNGDRLLSRQMEGFFSTSDVTDYAVIWERDTNQTTTVTPTPKPQDHQTAILLGWNDNNGNEVLFRSGMLGDEDWPVVAVTPQGNTLLAKDADSVTYGQLVTRSWTGSQILP
ncbi:hypothetical protein VB715_07925 [Crocosphaera sp. UHCC 0190]|uniref:hypothetical protein n=1 Tax=Crocosphaera sp. UHCC 0190 TaxID=3110246 RepID=UPI002B1EBE2D|nr:hypothetical protein [Crocosphaera sp. UHCC 0190]MEA5509690.1 hypothetical protein [Crocosphaera sp. UHCC 0190]